eukprot:546719_1
MMHLLLTVSFGGDSQEVIICVNLLLQAIYFYGSLHIVFEFINIAWFICLPWSCSFIRDCWQLGVCTYHSFEIATHCHSYNELIYFARLFISIHKTMVQTMVQAFYFFTSFDIVIRYINYALFIFHSGVARVFITLDCWQHGVCTYLFGSQLTVTPIMDYIMFSCMVYYIGFWFCFPAFKSNTRLKIVLQAPLIA